MRRRTFLLSLSVGVGLPRLVSSQQRRARVGVLGEPHAAVDAFREELQSLGDREAGPFRESLVVLL